MNTPHDSQPLARWCPAPDAQQFAGHFPAAVVVPGAALLDQVITQLQAACGQRVLAVRDAKFMLPVRPGDQVCLHVRPAPGQVRFVLRQADTGAAACSGTLTLEPAHAPA